MMGRNPAVPVASIAAAVLIPGGCDVRPQASLEAAAANPLAALTGNTVLTDD